VRSPTTPLPMENDPRVVFERLFGASQTTDPRSGGAARLGPAFDAVDQAGRRSIDRPIA
jgi:hypothetical protein